MPTDTLTLPSSGLDAVAVLLDDDPYAGLTDDTWGTAERTGVLRGYGRVSSKDQNLARQTKRLKAAGCINPLYLDKASGKNADRPQLLRILADLEPGDTLVVVSLDRLARNLDDLINIMKRIKAAGVELMSLSEMIDTNTPAGRLVFHVFGAIAQFVREIINDAAAEGIAAARARNVKFGRPSSMTPEKIAYALALMEDPEQSITSMAKLVGVSRSTLYNALPQLRGMRRPGRPALGDTVKADVVREEELVPLSELCRDGGPWTTALAFQLLGQADHYQHDATGVTPLYERRRILAAEASEEFAELRADRTPVAAPAG